MAIVNRVDLCFLYKHIFRTHFLQVGNFHE